MARGTGFSPTLLIMGTLAVVAGSAAALLGVESPSSSLLSSPAGATISSGIVIDAVLISPVLVLVGVIVWSITSTGGTGVSKKGAIGAIVVVAIVLVGLVWVLHQSPSLTDSAVGTLPNGGGSGGSGGHGGGGNGSGSSNGTGGHGSGGGSGGSGGSGGGVGGSGNSSNSSGGGSNGTNGTDNGTHNGTGGSGGGGGGGTGGKGNGTNGHGGTNLTPPTVTALAPPPASAWPLFAAVAGLSLLIGALVIPQLAARGARRRNSATLTLRQARSRAAKAFSRAASSLAGSTDPRGVIVELYSQLLARLEPRNEIPSSRTPEEIRSAHLLPLGVRTEAATHLTRLFEEACYSSHALSADEVRVARESIQIAEYDLRAAHAIG
ncbi:MAG TPA: DUF4129 domain-containing protein [Thermoplasmata archaeon]|nr:DUF4129 domain-containing protein [Thermoplasmata archaeon]